jgi:hypothetical protein
MSSAPVPKPGMPLTARCAIWKLICPFDNTLSVTADPSPPSEWWSSATTIRPEMAAAAAEMVAAAIDLTEWQSTTPSLDSLAPEKLCPQTVVQRYAGTHKRDVVALGERKAFDLPMANSSHAS